MAAAGWKQLLFLACSTVFQLTVVFRRIEMTLGFGHEAIDTEFPFLIPADAHRFSGAARTGIGPRQCPVIFDACTAKGDLVHEFVELGGLRTGPLRLSSAKLQPLL